MRIRWKHAPTCSNFWVCLSTSEFCGFVSFFVFPSAVQTTAAGTHCILDTHFLTKTLQLRTHTHRLAHTQARTHARTHTRTHERETQVDVQTCNSIAEWFLYFCCGEYKHWLKSWGTLGNITGLKRSVLHYLLLYQCE